MKIRISTYTNNPTWAGCVETDEWVVFVRHDGGHVYFGDRDPVTGAVK